MLYKSIPVPNFYILGKKPYSIQTLELRNFPICFWCPQGELSSLPSVDFPPAPDMEEETPILQEERTKRRRDKGLIVSLDTDDE